VPKGHLTTEIESPHENKDEKYNVDCLYLRNMKTFALIFLVLALIERAGADVGLYTVTKTNIASVKEFSLQTRFVTDSKVEFVITVPYDAKINKVKIEYLLWSHDLSKVLEEKSIDLSRHDEHGAWIAKVIVAAEDLRNSTIELFCGRNLPAETAYRIQLATFATENKK